MIEPAVFPPQLPEGSIVRLDGRGEVFVRRHIHPDRNAPTVLLLHGWTASVDAQFIAVYERLAETCSFVGLDHRGHGRGLRTFDRYELEDVADDAADEPVDGLDVNQVRRQLVLQHAQLMLRLGV